MWPKVFDHVALSAKHLTCASRCIWLSINICVPHYYYVHNKGHTKQKKEIKMK